MFAGGIPAKDLGTGEMQAGMQFAKWRIQRLWCISIHCRQCSIPKGPFWFLQTQIVCKREKNHRNTFKRDMWVSFLTPICTSGRFCSETCIWIACQVCAASKAVFTDSAVVFWKTRQRIHYNAIVQPIQSDSEWHILTSFAVFNSNWTLLLKCPFAFPPYAATWKLKCSKNVMLGASFLNYRVTALADPKKQVSFYTA